MFTGIVQAVGKIVRLDPLEIESAAFDLSDVAVGDSICVQGACLTVTALTRKGFTADVSAETYFASVTTARNVGLPSAPLPTLSARMSAMPCSRWPSHSA